jgi:deoxyribose-phosphate aldolase
MAYQRRKSTTIQIGKLKSNQDDHVLWDIQAVVNEVHDRAIVKVILETSLLTEEEKQRACELVVKAGANFVKTSTGFSTGGATVEDIRLMRSIVGANFGVKASGGIKSLADAEKMIAAGANRIGTSSGVQIVQGIIGNSSY